MQHDYNGFPNQRIARDIAHQFSGHSKVIVHDGRDLLMPIFSDRDGLSLTPQAISPLALPNRSPILRDLNTLWDITKYNEARQPVSLGIVDQTVRETFVQPLPAWCRHVLDMPIQFPGTEARLPRELASFAPALQRILNIEAQFNPEIGKYYGYLSIHQAELKAGERMRENPYHVDGFQGPRWQTKHPVNHSYLLSDRLPTKFFVDRFPLDHLDLNVDDVYSEFAYQIENSTVPTWEAQDFELILMDAYCVHRGAVAQQPMFRTWLRMSWETRIFDRLGNSHNPLFDYNWKMVARDSDPRIRPRHHSIAA